jgi:hypothetical protein
MTVERPRLPEYHRHVAGQPGPKESGFGGHEGGAPRGHGEQHGASVITLSCPMDIEGESQ